MFIVPMPVNIYRVTGDDQADNQDVAWLCDEEWELSPQVYALQEWVNQWGRALPPAEYVADIGFCWRRDAASGGPVLEPSSMRIMAGIGMSIYFSEYPGFSDGLDAGPETGT